MDEQDVNDLWIKVLSGADEIQARRFVAIRALELGGGGISRVSRLFGMSRSTIEKGISEITTAEEIEKPIRIRRIGGGRNKIEKKDNRVVKDLEAIMDETTAGDPMTYLKWTHKSTYTICEELRKKGHTICENTVGRLLKNMDYTLQANKKSREGGSHEERDAQFHYINKQINDFNKRGQPTISVDTKKKENVGNFKNAGRTWRKKGQSDEVNVYDFPSLGKGKAVPYGAYDPTRNEGFVNVGISGDTAEFAIESIRQWWKHLGLKHYHNAHELLITADCGGSNGYRTRGWKFFLQQFANETGIKITVCHYPPGTSKWNKIEHRMFSFISMNWRGKVECQIKRSHFSTLNLNN
ncbi:MAG: ISAzo13 family transposase [Firmicutes bacterium HGW-Firmicutes-13]|nr:MAG: ISAzo13 family transposase [Firmicutes bacterium HGW-Firmicutes-13]